MQTVDDSLYGSCHIHFEYSYFSQLADVYNFHYKLYCLQFKQSFCVHLGLLGFNSSLLKTKMDPFSPLPCLHLLHMSLSLIPEVCPLYMNGVGFCSEMQSQPLYKGMILTHLYLLESQVCFIADRVIILCFQCFSYVFITLVHFIKLILLKLLKILIPSYSACSLCPISKSHSTVLFHSK